MLERWDMFPHAQVTVVNARVKDIIKRCTGPRVLEVGCNEGFVAKALMEAGHEVVAVDNRQAAIDQCKLHFGFDALMADANKLPFEDGSFDTVVGGEILEHLPNPGLGLAEMFRVSRNQVLLTLPIGRYWKDELTHAWQLNGSVIEHEQGITTPFFKHVFVVEFRKIRELQPDGNYAPVFAGNEGYEDR